MIALKILYYSLITSWLLPLYTLGAASSSSSSSSSSHCFLAMHSVDNPNYLPAFHNRPSQDKLFVSKLLYWYCSAHSATVAEAEKIIISGADVNIISPDGSTPLWCAVFNKNTALVNFLLSRGARPHKSRFKGFSLLSHSTPEITKLLLDDSKDKDIAHGVAVKEGRFDVSELEWAIKKNQSHEKIKLLLEAKALSHLMTSSTNWRQDLEHSMLSALEGLIERINAHGGLDTIRGIVAELTFKDDVLLRNSEFFKIIRDLDNLRKIVAMVFHDNKIPLNKEIIEKAKSVSISLTVEPKNYS